MPADQGQWIVNWDGTINVSWLDFGTDLTMGYTVADDNGNTDSSTIRIRHPLGSGPQVSHDEFVAGADGGAQLLGDVLDNDVIFHVPHSDLTVDTFSQPAHGHVDIAPGGDVTYTPDPGYEGADSLSYAVSGAGHVAHGTVSISVIDLSDLLGDRLVPGETEEPVDDPDSEGSVESCPVVQGCLDFDSGDGLQRADPCEFADIDCGDPEAGDDPGPSSKEGCRPDSSCDDPAPPAPREADPAVELDHAEEDPASEMSPAPSAPARVEQPTYTG